MSLIVFLRGQAPFWRGLGIEWTYVSSPGTDLQAAASRDAARAVPIRMHRAITPLSDLGAIWKLWRLMVKERPDLVHTHTPKAGILGQTAAWLADVPLTVHTVHGLPHTAKTGPKAWALRGAEQLTCALAHRVTFVAPWLLREAVVTGLCRADKAVVFGAGSFNGVDTQWFCPSVRWEREALRLRSTHGIAQAAPVVGFIGRLVGDKGLGDLARAWAGIRERVPSAHLVLIGPAEEQDNLKEEVWTYLREQSTVHLPGASWEVRPWYALFDVLILPTRREGLPNVLLEAAAMEVPVVASDIPACRDVVLAGRTGLLFPVGDVNALASATQRLLANPLLRRRMGAAARKHVQRCFRPADRWQRMANLYRDLAQAEPSLHDDGGN